MAHLHELLAVEGDLEATSKKVIDEAAKTFANKEAHFMGIHKRWELFDDNEAVNTPPDEFQKMETTVDKKLDYVAEHVGRYIDAIFQKESTNQIARADLVVDGEVLIEGAPATFLLGLEKRLIAFREMYAMIPTLRPGIHWVTDPEQGCYRLKYPEERFKTAKKPMHQVMTPATDRHPAQVRTWEDTVNVGKSITNLWSGMISAAEKSALMGRLDRLIQAVKQARMRANNTTAVTGKVAERLLQFVNKG